MRHAANTQRPSGAGKIPFLGRSAELEELVGFVENAGSCVVTGAPGSGKSRLLKELKAVESKAVFVGRCMPETMNAAYGPFREIASRSAEALDPRAMFGTTDPRSRDLGVLFPHLPVDLPEGGMTDARRHGLWIALSEYLRKLASERGLILIVEDLHWADQDSLSLLRWLLGQTEGFGVVATSRIPTPAGFEAMPEVSLRPLTRQEIAPALAAFNLEQQSAELHQQTGGIPLLIHEWIHRRRRGLDHLDIAESIAHLDESTRRALASAALMSDRVDLADLASITDIAVAQLHHIIDDLKPLGAVVREPNGELAFLHETYRAAFAQGLGVSETIAMHRRIYQQLESTQGVDLSLLPVLAHHAIKAAQDGERHDAIRLCMAAGQHALDILSAPATAQNHFSKAVELAELESDVATLLKAELGLATAMTRSFDPGASDFIPQVLEHADQVDDPVAFAKASLLVPESRGPTALPYRGDFIAAARMSESLQRIDAADPLRGRLSAGLALQQHASLHEHDFFNLVSTAESIAIETGDSDLDAAAFIARHGILRPRGTLETRLAAATKRLISEPPNSRWHLQYFDIVASSLFRLGRIEELDNQLNQLEARLEPLTITARWSIIRLRAAIAHAVGDLDTFERLATEAMVTAGGSSFADAAEMYFGFQVATLMRDKCMTAEASPAIDAWVEADPTYLAFRASRAAQRADHGDLAASLTDLAVIFAQDLGEFSTRVEGLPTLELATLAAFKCSRPDYCEMAWEALRHFRSEWILVGAGSVLMGPVLQSMALASSGMGAHARALQEIEEAREMTLKSRTVLSAWHTLRDKGLIAQRAGDLRLAEESLRLAQERYETGGLLEQAAFCAESIATLHDTGFDAQVGGSASERGENEGEQNQAKGRLERDGHVWHLRAGDERASLSHVKGLTMLQALLTNPGVYLSCALLSSLAEGAWSGISTSDALSEGLSSSGSPQAVVDSASIAAYRGRVEELETALDRADRRNDQEASDRLSLELDAILSELAQVTGLGGRSRNMTDDDERARVRVTKAIRSAIRRIEEIAPVAGQHLGGAIRTGTLCCYQPDPRNQIEWQ